TGVSWANGIGRGGSVVGSMAGGAMLAMGVPLSTAFAVVAAPCVIAAVAVLTLGVVRAGAARVAAADGMAGRQA
ncbi:aromatic acid/H+ symport family MFS transporter, partial [Burkholderia cenocepacia]|nr:aromatic acid/H+ symport family MFS transporter [Burkholderia cenocepacia]